MVIQRCLTLRDTSTLSALLYTVRLNLPLSPVIFFPMIPPLPRSIVSRILFALVGVLFGETLCRAADVWVAVGYGGRRMSSTDGVKWEITAEWAEKGGDDSNNLMGLAYGLGKFVAVGGGGWSRETQGGHILVSKDGRDGREIGRASCRERV